MLGWTPGGSGVGGGGGQVPDHPIRDDGVNEGLQDEVGRFHVPLSQCVRPGGIEAGEPGGQQHISLALLCWCGKVSEAKQGTDSCLWHL